MITRYRHRLRWLAISFILVLFFINAASSHCEAGIPPYFFKHLNIDDGLSQNSVVCILQDSKGFMWFGTKDGLNRYDGINFKIYTPDNTKYQLEDCFVNRIYEDAKGIIWIGTDKGVSLYDPATEKIQSLYNYTNGKSSIQGRIRSVIADRNGIIWIAEEFKGIYTFNPVTKELCHIKTTNDGLIAQPLCIFEDKDGAIWVGTILNGLFRYNTRLNAFDLLQTKNRGTHSLQIESIAESGRELFLGTFNEGLFKLDKVTLELIPVLNSDENNNILYVHTVIKNDPNEIWMGTETGLYIYNLNTAGYTHLQQSYFNRYALSDNAIYSIYKDKSGGIWIGTYFGGVNYLPYQYTPFYKYYPQVGKSSVSGKAIREFTEDNEGYIWIGTEDAGLNRFDPRTGNFTQYLGLNYQKNYFNIHALQMDGDKLWVGTYKDGLYQMDVKSNTVKHYNAAQSPKEVFALCKDRTGKLWMGAFRGAFIYDKASDRFKKIDEVGNYFIYDIKEDHSGNIWFAAISLGVICYNPITKEIKYYKNDPKDPNSISPKIIGIYVDKKNTVWLSSEGQGLYKLNRQNSTFKRYSVENGLPNNVVYYLTQDSKGDLWFGTNGGLVNMNPETDAMRVYTLEDGLICDQFNYKSAFAAKDGHIYMGTVNGFISFNPVTFKNSNDNYTPILTGFQIFSKEVAIGGASPLKKSISLTGKIVLKYNQNTISFDFASFNYNSPETHSFLYRLEGLDDNWIALKDNRKITYSNLSPGRYLLKIKTSGSDNERKLDIIIQPPFWLSIYAYILYSFLFIALVYFFYKKSTSYIREKHQKNIEALKEEKEKEAYDAKITFFTNVAHEIRTPLSLIKAPLEHILKENKVDKDTKDDLLIMQRNSDHLSTLINQLLDFRKTESGKFVLNFQYQNISLLLEAVYERFLPTLHRQGIKAEKQLLHDALWADVDSEAFTKIISNLFTNALKNAKSFVRIGLVCDAAGDQLFKVYLRNDGTIIQEEMFEKIFEPFFQVNASGNENMKTGTGIGLSLSKSLAELHSGKLYIVKESSEYNTFVLELPMQQPNATIRENDTAPDKAGVLTNTPSAGSSDIYAVLLIEDNREMLDFIQKKLKKEYHVHAALNGREALALLDEEHIDLIISDIAMPEMDGFEFLQNLKSDFRYCHIPTILLSAKTNLQSKIEGLELGADAYIEKPFSMDFLSVQIKNLLDGRKKLRDVFVKSPHLHSNTIALTKADEDFIEKINDLIEQNIENESFNIDYITDSMHMSRSTLLRKIKGISGLTVNEYIRLIRLKKAAQLLEEGKYRINEICFLTGFSSTSYFAKCFQKQYGVLPKDFLTALKNEKE